MITDVGLDALGATHAWLDSVSNCALGTGNANNRRDSSPVTITQSGTTATASGSFFLSTDVGAILKYGSGSAGLEVYITAYISPTQVTVSISSIQPAQIATVWFVNQTALETQVIPPFSTTYASDLIGFTNVAGVATVTLTKYFLSPAFSANHTINELGWFSATEMFGRALVGGVGDAVSTGQQYEVICELSVVCSPSTPTAFADVSGGAWNTAGTGGLEYAPNSFGSIFNDDDRATGILEAKNFQTVAALATATFTQVDMTTSPVAGVANVPSDSTSIGSYTTGTFTRSFTATWNVTSAVTTIYGILIGLSRAFSLLFTTPIAKDSLHQLTITWTTSWQRILTN